VGVVAVALASFVWEQRHGPANSVEKRCREVEDDPAMWVLHVSGGDRGGRSLMEISQGHFGLFTSKSLLA
jgi:hypothetical protein